MTWIVFSATRKCIYNQPLFKFPNLLIFLSQLHFFYLIDEMYNFISIILNESIAVLTGITAKIFFNNLILIL